MGEISNGKFCFKVCFTPISNGLNSFASESVSFAGAEDDIFRCQNKTFVLIFFK